MLSSFDSPEEADYPWSKGAYQGGWFFLTKQFFRAELPNMDDPEASLDEYNIRPAVNTANRMAALRFQWIPSKEKPTKMP